MKPSYIRLRSERWRISNRAEKITPNVKSVPSAVNLQNSYLTRREGSEQRFLVEGQRSIDSTNSEGRRQPGHHRDPRRFLERSDFESLLKCKNIVVVQLIYSKTNSAYTIYSLGKRSQHGEIRFGHRYAENRKRLRMSRTNENKSTHFSLKLLKRLQTRDNCSTTVAGIVCVNAATTAL